MKIIPGAKYPFPNELSHPNIKADKVKWGLPCAKAIWSAANSANSPNVFFKKRRAYENALKLAFGQQNIDKYKPFLGINPKDKAGQWVTAIDWRSKNYATKLLRMVTEKLRSVRYDAYVELTDPTSIDLRDNAKGKLKMVMNHQAFLSEMSEMVGRDLIGISPDDIPLNDEDVDVNMEMNYKDRLAVELEDGIDYRLKRNNWDQLEELLKFDIATFNAAVLYVNTDDFNRTTVERIYPGNGITPESDNPYFNDIRYGAHIVYPTVAELKSMAGDELTNDDIEKIFKENSTENWSTFERDRSEVLDYRDTARTRVLCFRYATTNEVVYLEYTDENGRQRFVEKDYDFYKTYKQRDKFEAKYGDKQKLHRKPVTVIYQGYWVIDTDYIFKYGVKANTYYQKIKGKLGEPLLGYIFVNADYFEGRSVSLLEHIEPTLDELEILDKRIQKELSTPFPGGVEIDIAALQNIKFAFQGKNIEMGDIIEMAIHQKIFIVNSQGTLAGSPGSTYQAVRGVQAPGHTLAELLQVMQIRLLELERLIGFNPASSASQVQNDQLVKVTQMQIMETNTALGSFFRSFKFVFTELSKILAGTHLIEIKNDNTGQYDAIFGLDSTDFVRDLDEVDIGINVEARPTEEDWQNFRLELSQEVAKGTISEGDKIAILRFKNLKKAQAYMRSVERKRARAEAQARERDIQLNAQAQQASNEQAMQGKMAELQAQGMLLDKEGQVKTQHEQVRGMNKDRHIRTQADLNLRNTQVLQGQKAREDAVKTRTTEANKFRIASLKDKQKPKPKKS